MGDRRVVTEYLARYLVMFDRGDLVEAQQIRRDRALSVWRVILENPSGRASYLLSLFERLSFDQAPFPIRLMSYLSERGLPVPAPLATLDGMNVTIFSGKPAILVREPEALCPDPPTADQCASMGDLLARLPQEMRQSRLQPRSAPIEERVAGTLQEVAERLSPDERGFAEQLLSECLARLASYPALPRGFVHGNPTRDAVRMDGASVVALHHLHRAGQDYLLSDLAVAVVDWCTSRERNVDATRYDMMVSAYERSRAWTPDEHAAWPFLLRLGALELWCDTLLDEPDPAAVDAARTRVTRTGEFANDLT